MHHPPDWLVILPWLLIPTLVSFGGALLARLGYRAVRSPLDPGAVRDRHGRIAGIACLVVGVLLGLGGAGVTLFLALFFLVGAPTGC
jgi:hypothetical protein